MPQELISAGPSVIQLDLSVGRVNERLDVPAGTYFAVWDSTPRSLDPLIYVGFDRSDRQAQIPFRWKEARLGRFRQIYITNLAQANTRVTLVVGDQHEFALRAMPSLSPGASAFGRVAALTSPAVGLNYTGAADAATLGGRRYRIIAVNFTLVTDANVASRLPRIEFTRTGGAGITLATVAATTHPASTTRRYYAAQHLAANADAVQHMELPSDVFLDGPITLNIPVDNIQAGDQLSALELIYEEL